MALLDERRSLPNGVQAEISILPPRRLYIDRHHGHRSVYAGNLTESRFGLNFSPDTDVPEIRNWKWNKGNTQKGH
jgi:hypothetical protein